MTSELAIVKADGPKAGCDCDVMVVGTAPGAQEQEAGKPMVGKTGEVVREIFQGLGISDNVCYTNLIRHRLVDERGASRKPTSDEIFKGSAHLVADIERLKPNLIVAMGATPLEFFMGRQVLSLKLLHGLVLSFNRFDLRLSVMPVYDPAYVARSGGLLSSVGDMWVSDLRFVRDYLETGRG